MTLADTYATAAAALTQSEHYVRSASLEHRKKFGQFFTPPRVATLMADWCLANTPTSMLDPSAGTGDLAAACVARAPSLDIDCFEIDEKISRAFRKRLPCTKLFVRDYLEVWSSKRYDAVIMNPPYIRHREIEGRDADRQKISLASGVPIPKSANLYIYFCQKALVELARGGRAAFLIPSEWMNANFARNFKELLLDRNYLREIVVFSAMSPVFSDALTTASVLLIEAK